MIKLSFGRRRTEGD